MSTLITHTLNITKKVSEMILIHWDNSKGHNTVSLNPTLTLSPHPGLLTFMAGMQNYDLE